MVTILYTDFYLSFFVCFVSMGNSLVPMTIRSTKNFYIFYMVTMVSPMFLWLPEFLLLWD